MSTEIIDRLQDYIKVTMKAREGEKLEALRFLYSEIKNVGINEGRELTDDDALVVVGRLIKQRQESVEQFKKGGREDLVAREEMGINLYREYLPPQLSVGELKAIVAEAVVETSAAGLKDMGKVMGIVTKKLMGKADGKPISTIVRNNLN